MICEPHATGSEDGDYVHRYLVAAAEASGGGRVFLRSDVAHTNDAGEVDKLVRWYGVVGNLHLDVLVYPDVGMEPATFFLSFARLAPLQVTLSPVASH